MLIGIGRSFSDKGGSFSDKKNFRTEVQSSNKHELKLNVAGVNGKAGFLKMASPPSQITNNQPQGKESIKRVEYNVSLNSVPQLQKCFWIVTVQYLLNVSPSLIAQGLQPTGHEKAVNSHDDIRVTCTCHQLLLLLWSLTKAKYCLVHIYFLQHPELWWQGTWGYPKNLEILWPMQNLVFT